MKLQVEYEIQVNYKSGVSMRFWVTEFSINGDEWSWRAADPKVRPIDMGATHAESVWQVGTRTVPMEVEA